jgi:HNH endonuclease
MTNPSKRVAAPPLQKSTTEGPNPSGFCMCNCGRRTLLAKHDDVKTGQVKGKPRRFCTGHRFVFKECVPLKKRFWAKVNKLPGNNSCWLWTASKDTFGYGQICVKGEMFSSHRVSFEMSRGKIPDGAQVLHKCDNPSCIRPKHLFLGNDAINSKDRVAKGRQAKGEKIHTAKLTARRVMQLRSLRAEGYKYTELSEWFGIGVPQVFSICKGRAWKHIQ